MIEIKNLVKKFDDTVALNGLSCNICEGTIFGLAGSNGSGKSTLLRTLSGVFHADGGEITIDGQSVYDNHVIKERSFFISDYPFFENGATITKLANMMRPLYSNWDEERYKELCTIFPLEKNKKIINMSKGMQRQAALIMAFSTRPKYLFLDEIFDGLDPVIRKQLKKLIIEDVTDNNMTCIIASHNLREIDDICDKIVMIHKGALVTNEDTDILKDTMHRIQLAFDEKQPDDLFEDMDVQVVTNTGNYYSIMVRGDIAEIEAQLRGLNPVFLEVLPATLEEVFISEMEGAGYGK